MDVDAPSHSELAAAGRVCIPAILPLGYDCTARYGSGFVRIAFSFFPAIPPFALPSPPFLITIPRQHKVHAY